MSEDSKHTIKAQIIGMRTQRIYHTHHNNAMSKVTFKINLRLRKTRHQFRIFFTVTVEVGAYTNETVSQSTATVAEK